MAESYESHFNIIKLIDAVEKRPCLWKLENKSSEKEKSDIWSKISPELGVTEEILRIKWNDLKSTFKREIKRLNIKNLDEYIGDWQYFHRMRFIYKLEHIDNANEDENNIDSYDVMFEKENEKTGVKLEETSTDANYGEGFCDNEKNTIMPANDFFVKEEHTVMAIKEFTDEENDTTVYVKNQFPDELIDTAISFKEFSDQETETTISKDKRNINVYDVMFEKEDEETGVILEETSDANYGDSFCDKEKNTIIPANEFSVKQEDTIMFVKEISDKKNDTTVYVKKEFPDERIHTAIPFKEFSDQETETTMSADEYSDGKDDKIICYNGKNTKTKNVETKNSELPCFKRRKKICKVHAPQLDPQNLIDEVKKHPCIWNTEDINYFNRNEGKRAWSAVSSKLGIPEKILRLKWKNLRDKFIREMKRSNIKNPDEFKGSWSYFHNLWFVRGPKYAGYNINDEEKSADSDNVFTQTVDEKGENIKFSDKDDDIIVSDDKKRVRTTSPQPKDDEQLYHTKIMEQEEEKDFDMMFLESLTPYLKQLDPIRKLVIRNNMQQMLIDEIAKQNCTEFIKKS